MIKKTILLDLDGVLNEYTGDYNENFIPPLRKGAREFIEHLVLKYDIKLFTTRDRKLVSHWLNDNNIDDLINEVTNKKELSWLFIDDRCICFNGKYENLLSQIDNFEAWYKSL